MDSTPPQKRPHNVRPPPHPQINPAYAGSSALDSACHLNTAEWPDDASMAYSSAGPSYQYPAPSYSSTDYPPNRNTLLIASNWASTNVPYEPASSSSSGSGRLCPQPRLRALGSLTPTRPRHGDVKRLYRIPSVRLLMPRLCLIWFVDRDGPPQNARYRERGSPSPEIDASRIYLLLSRYPVGRLTQNSAYQVAPRASVRLVARENFSPLGNSPTDSTNAYYYQQQLTEQQACIPPFPPRSGD
jgi:hypothetical protein